MKKDIIRAVPVQRLNVYTDEETTQIDVRLHMAHEETGIGTVTVRAFNSDYRLVAEGEHQVSERKHTMTRCTVKMTLYLDMEWKDEYYHFIVIKNCGNSLLGRTTMKVDITGGTTTMSTLEKFDLYSFDYFYANESESGVSYPLMYCDLTMEQRKNLLHTLMFLGDVISEHHSRYDHAPHFFLTGDEDQTILQAESFHKYFMWQHYGVWDKFIWKCTLREFLNEFTPYGFKTKSNVPSLIVVKLETDVRHDEVVTLFRRMNTDIHLKYATILICGTEECYREWEELYPGVLADAHFISPLRPFLGEPMELPAADVAPKADGQPADKKTDLGELEALVGLRRVKQEVTQAYTMAGFARRRMQIGLPAMGDNRQHMLFLGNPGTGKTTVAKLIGRMYHDMGWLSKGHTVEMNRSKLVGEYIGHTEAKTTQAIEDARGGVLFIDEAYALVQPVGASNDFGREVLNALMTVLSEPNPDMIIILAGYEDRMEQMLESNAGLRDRFPLTLHFDDFTADELLQMAENLAHGQGFEFAPEAKERLLGMIERAVRARDPHFGNGRWLHNLMEHGILKAMAERVMKSPASADERLLLTRIEEADVLSADELWLSQRTTLRPARCHVGF
jgi:hypothetical protein